MPKQGKIRIDDIANRLSSGEPAVYLNIFQLLKDCANDVDVDHNLSVSKQSSLLLAGEDTMKLTSVSTHPNPETTDVESSVVEDESQLQHTISQTGMKCSTCQCDFDSVENQRGHFKGDWHRLNLKLKQQKRPIVTEKEAENFLSMSDIQTADGYVSVSGSESEEEGIEEEGGLVRVEASTCIPLRLGLRAACWNALIANKIELVEALQQVQLDKNDEQSNRRWAIFLYTAGHFAGTIFRNESVVRSKTFHRYVVRKKQGGAQSKNDNGKGKAKSAGATIRRHNEQMLKSEVKDLIDSWESELKCCSRIYISATKQNQGVVFQSPDIFTTKDPRVRRIPFQVKRPTLNETKRTLLRLCLAKVELTPAIDEKSKEEVRETEQTNDILNSPLVDKPQLTKEETLVENEVLVDLEIHTLCTQGGPVSDVESLLSNQNNDQDVANLVPIVDQYGALGLPPLHLAASHGHDEIVAELLRCGANPGLRDLRGRLAYNCSADKRVRDVFRLYRGEYPEKWDYQDTGIPEPLTDAVLDEKKAKQKAKKKRQAAKKKLQKQKETEAREMAEKARAEREKAELEAAERCGNCDRPLVGPRSDFFFCNDFAYCTSRCLQSHRRVLAAAAAEQRMLGTR